jgi:hypothetical protein
MATHVRIIATPPGEAPLWAREKWVGLELPLAGGDRGPRGAHTSGVLSGPRNRFTAALWLLLGRLSTQYGYAVDALGALAVLEKTSPEAAAWWRENVPRAFTGRRKFLFASRVCQVVETDSALGKDG